MNTYIKFHTADGDVISDDEIFDHNLMETLVSFSGTDPVHIKTLRDYERETVTAWLRYLAADSERIVRQLDKVIDMFKGYPEGTTMGEIMSGTAKKILSAVED